jgi:hypothetical protein
MEEEEEEEVQDEYDIDIDHFDCGIGRRVWILWIWARLVWRKSTWVGWSAYFDSCDHIDCLVSAGFRCDSF